MNQLDLDLIREFVNENIDEYHVNRAKKIESVDTLKLLTRKNPYLYKANNLHSVSDLAEHLLNAHSSSSDEGIFGNFLETLAIYVSELTTGGRKSGITGVDLEFSNEGVDYIVAIKSGPNWANSSQWSQLKTNFDTAIGVMKQNNRTRNVQAVCGMCYGRNRTRPWGSHTKIYGQSFWQFISDNPTLYTDIIEPLGYRAQEHNDVFLVARSRAINAISRTLLERFVVNNEINWQAIVEYNSKNLADEYSVSA